MINHEETTHQLRSIFEEYILVTCPDCGEAATLLGCTHFTCRHCGFHAERPTSGFPNQAIVPSEGRHSQCFDQWFGQWSPRVKPCHSGCQECGASLPRSRIRTTQHNVKKPQLFFICSKCGTKQRVPVSWEPIFDPTEARDPFFGAALYLRRELSPGTLYAYNYEHACLLIDLFTACKSTERPNTMVAQSLLFGATDWATKIKHRDAVLRALTSMRESAANVSETHTPLNRQ